MQSSHSLIVMKCRLSLFVLIVFAGGQAHGVEFQTDVLPIFSSRCKDCHMEGKSKGHLSLDLEKIPRAIGSGKSIVPGDAEKSDLVKMLLLPEGNEDRMPPKGAPLSEGEIGKIKSWIAEGAKLPEGAEGDKKPEGEKKADEKPKETAAASPETWTSVAGTSITATLLKVDPARKTIVLKREDGSTTEVPIAKLDEASRAKAKAFWDANK